MTTRIELGGYKMGRDRFTIAKLPDITGVYHTQLGEVGIDFRRSKTHQGGDSKQVVIDCSGIKTL